MPTKKKLTKTKFTQVISDFRSFLSLCFSVKIAQNSIILLQKAWNIIKYNKIIQRNPTFESSCVMYHSSYYFILSVNK